MFVWRGDVARAGLTVVLALTGSGGWAQPRASQEPGKVLYTIGNLSPSLLAEAWGSPFITLQAKIQRVEQLMPAFVQRGGNPAEIQRLGETAGGLARESRFQEATVVADRMLALLGDTGQPASFDMGADESRELDKILQQARTVQTDGIEDYIGWAVVERSQGVWDWSVYRENARRIKAQGLKYIPYVWIQNLPKWVRKSPDYSFATCLEHGQRSEYLSVYSPKTVEAYDRFFAKLHAALGDSIDLLRIGSPSDYGETAYPAGAATAFFPVEHVHMGWWVGETEARRHFHLWLQRKYGTPARLSAAWGVPCPSFEVDYPKDNRLPRRWLDFVAWYHEGLTERLGVLFDTARKHFPHTPICVNIGWPFEKIVLGQDLSGLVKMLASRGMIVRSPTGPMVPWLFTRRVATAVRQYHPAGFSSEPADGTASIAEVGNALFKDATTGVTWHFDYPGNMLRAPELFAQARQIPRHAYSRVDTAVFFSTTAHRLEDWDNWREGFQGGFPDGMAPWLEKLRGDLDYDVIDERLIADGALKRYRTVVWPFGMTTEASTIRELSRWVGQGGMLLVRDMDAVRTVEGAHAGIAPGRGVVVDARGSLDALAERIRGGDGRMTVVLPSGAMPGGVLSASFPDGLLLLNRSDQTLHVNLREPNLSSSTRPRRPASVEAPPQALQWVGK